MLANQSQRRVAKGLAAPVIARTAALLRDQSLCATGVKCSTKPENLATANIHQRASGFRRERAIPQIDHHAQPGQLPLAHPNHRHRTTPQTSRRQLVPVTSQSGTRVTSLSMTYKRVPAAGRYGKSRRLDELASRYEPAELNRIGFRLYEKFRPDVPYGNEGWGKRAVLDVEMIRAAT